MTRQKTQHAPGILAIGRLTQGPASNDDSRICAKHDGLGMQDRRSGRLGLGKANDRQLR